MSADVAELGIQVDSRDVTRAGRDLDRFKRSGERAEHQINQTARASQNSSSKFRQLAGGIGAAVAAMGAMNLVGRSIQSGLGLSAALAETSTLIEGTVEEMDLLKKASIDLAKTYGGTATQQVEAFYQAISAGAGDVEQAAELLDVSNRFAVAGVTTVTTAVDVLTTATNAYAAAGLTAADAADTMFVGIRRGKTTADELGGALGGVIPIASAAGVSFEELVGAVAALTTQGQSTAQAATGIKQAIAAIINPTSQAEAAAERLGIQFNASALEANGLQAVLGEVIEKTGGSSEELAELFGSVEALNAVLSMAGGGGEQFATIMEDMGNRAGATDEAFNKVSNSLERRYTVMMDRAKIAMEQIGLVMLEILVPAMEKAFAIGGRVADVFGSLPDPVQKVAKAIGIAVGVIAPLAATFGAISFAIGPLVAGLGLLLTPIGAIVAAFGVAAYMIYDNWETIKTAFWSGIGVIQTTAASILEGIQSIVDGFLGIGGLVVEALKSAWEGIKAELTSWAVSMKEIGKDIFSGLAEGLLGEATHTGPRSLGTYIGNEIEEGTRDALDTHSPSRVFYGIGQDVTQGLADGIDDGTNTAVTAVEKMSGQISSVMDSLRSSGEGLLNDLFAGKFKTVGDFFKGLVGMFKSALGQMLSIAAKNSLASIFGGGATAGSSGGTGILGALTGGGGGGGMLSGLLGTITSGLSTGITNVVGGLFSGGLSGAASGFATSMAGATSSLAGFSTAVGAALPVIGVVAAALSFFSKKVIGAGVGGTLGGDAGFDGYTYKKTSQFWGLSKKTSTKGMDAATGDPIAQAFFTIRENVLGMSETLGLSAADAVLAFQTKFKFDTRGMDQEEIAQRINEELRKAGDGMAELALGTDEFSLAGETALETLTRLSSSLLTVNDAFDDLGLRLFDISLAGADAASQLTEALGGLSGFQSAAQFYMDNFYSESERFGIATKNMQEVLASIGVDAIPASTQAFRQLLTGLQEIGDTEGVATLLKVAPAFIDLMNAGNKLADSLDRTARSQNIFATRADEQFAQGGLYGQMPLNGSGRDAEANQMLMEIVTEIRAGNIAIARNTAKTATYLERQVLVAEIT